MSEEPRPAAAERAKERGRPKARVVRRWARRLAWALAGSLALVLVLVLCIFYTAMGTRLAVQVGLSIYDDMIPGSVSMGAVDGSLASGVELGDVRLEDASGAPLVEVGEARMSLDPIALVGLEVRTGVIELDGVDVYMLDTDSGGFADLGPRSDGEPSPPSPTFGPDLPVSLIGAVNITQSRILVGATEAPEALETWVEAPHLHLTFDAEGMHAAVSIEGRVEMPSLDLRVGWFEVRIRWDEPRATIESILVESTAGDLQAREVLVDVSNERAELAALDFAGNPAWLGKQFGLPLQDRAQLRLSASGTLGEFSADAELVAPDDGALAVTVEGSLAPVLDVSVWADAAVEEAVIASEFLAPALEIEVDARLAGDPSDGLGARLEARCNGCVVGVEGVRAQAWGHASPLQRWGWLEASLTAPSITAKLRGGALPDGPAGVVADVEITQLATFAPIFDRLVPNVPIAGELVVHAGCAGHQDASRAVCDAEVSLDRGRPLQALRLRAAGWSDDGEELRVDVQTLEASADGSRLALTKAPATFRLHPARASVEQLRLSLASPTGSGNIAVDGELGLAAPRTVDAKVAVRGLSLAAANAFVPGLDAAGRLDAEATLRGAFNDPTGLVHANGSSLRIAGVDVGALELAASYDDGRARAGVSVNGPDLGRVEIDANAQLIADLDRGEVSLARDHEVRLSLLVEELPLTTAGRFIPSLHDLSGRLGAEVEVSGRPRTPVVHAELEVTEPRMEKRRLPDVRLEGDYAGRNTSAEIRATHPSAFETLELDAEIPMDLNLALPRPRLHWRSREGHQLALRIRNAHPEAIAQWRPDVVASGDVDVDVHVTGDMHAPTIEAEVQGRELGFGGRLVGTAAVDLRYLDEQATIRLEGSGPIVSGVGLTAEIPVSLSPASGTADWRHDDAHRVRISVNELMLDRAMQWAPRSVTEAMPLLRGRVNVLAALDGSARRPRLSVESEMDDLEVDGRALGQVDVAGDYQNDRASVQLGWDKTTRHSALVTADVPVSVDLADGTFVWNDEADHHLRLGIPRIDAEVLESFVDAEGFEGATALYAIADGHLAAFEASASLTGNVRAGGLSHRLRANLHADEAEQSFALDVGGDQAHPLARIEANAAAAVPDLVAGADWKPTRFAVRLDADEVDLSTLAPFAPADVQGLRGVLSAHASAGGTLGAPKVDGDIRLRDTEATVVPLRQRLEKVEVIASLHDDTIELARVHVESGGGSVEGSGRWVVAAGFGLDGSASTKLERIPLRSPGLPRMTFTGDITTRLAVGLDATRVGVAIRDARVDVFTDTITAAKTIPTNDNVEFVDFAAPKTIPSDPVEASATAPSRTTEIEVSLVDPVAIIGPSVDMRWQGSVSATSGPGSGPAADGALESAGGRFNLLGNDFQIERGSVTLTDDGSNVPFVDLVAVTTVDEITITATVRGPLPRPELALSSAPPMSQSDIFTVLVTGSADTQEADPDEVEAKAASVLAAMSNPALQQQLNSKLRVDKVGIGFGDSTDQPILTVGKHVSKKVYAETEYQHNAPKTQNRAEVRVEYRFWPRWSIETFFGDAAAGGVDLLWGRAFDTKPPAEP